MDITNKFASHYEYDSVQSMNTIATESASRNEVGDDGHHPFGVTFVITPQHNPC